MRPMKRTASGAISRVPPPAKRKLAVSSSDSAAPPANARGRGAARGARGHPRGARGARASASSSPAKPTASARGRGAARARGSRGGRGRAAAALPVHVHRPSHPYGSRGPETGVPGNPWNDPRRGPPGCPHHK
ncbi:hypothetical protein PRIPAC_85746 [Pristionchus pacificus]|uniref:Uncharacterized protein n=1 Tax=Pristionchus pacificus TaxID=54126 RepID=A0A2A6BV42_PRIPA|nr:hypothetical protein PRIPAC_85746 [Pristionchus pacificus]|eukprot:PDM69784.1 hypothetical protein PRIPAC_44880 [Pristionchus pacificus]